ncbi:hypothetical protein ILYODFUR_033459 [Ilyodon furcidens]|uniref:Uncharacterized protein n=1 Tax=Ilyodon furcidens TaxID=33524 RepID=A0ABV0SRL3_9TELE
MLCFISISTPKCRQNIVYCHTNFANTLSKISPFRLCKVTLSLIIKHFGENGARPRLRKKSPQPQDPRFICSEQLYGVLEFLKNSAVDHTIMLPGRHPGHRDWHVKLMPTRVSKA